MNSEKFLEKSAKKEAVKRPWQRPRLVEKTDGWEAVLEKIKSKLKETSNGCIEWQGCRNKKGYGIIGVQRKTYIVHRLFYALSKDGVQSGKVVCHTCDNPSCCKLDHLWEGTQQENVKDAVSKGRIDLKKLHAIRPGHYKPPRA